MLSVWQLGKLEKIRHRLSHPDRNLELGTWFFPSLYFNGERPYYTFGQDTVPTAKHLKATVIRGRGRTFGSEKGRVFLVETSRAIRKQSEKSHLTLKSDAFQGEDGWGRTLLFTLPHFLQLSEGLIILWDERQFQKWLLTSPEHIQDLRECYFMFLLG